MPRLVVVSNRVDVPRKGSKAGGLAVALREALEKNGGLWFGWSGETVADDANPTPRQLTQGKTTFVTTDLPKQDYEEFYNGFSNSTLWPLFHYRLGLVELSRRSYQGYLRVNARFARALAPLLRPDDILWIHDYHLIPLGDELRKQGVENRMGFFLHTPFPVPELLVALPGHRRLMQALCAYDLIGFQTNDDVRAFQGYIEAEAHGQLHDDGVFTAYGRCARTKAYPIGIDTSGFARLARERADAPDTRRLRASLGKRKLILGVERLDYSKGLSNRFDAVEQMLITHPDLRGSFEFMQIAAPSREEVAKYRSLKRNLEAAAGRINGRFSDFDWQPVRYLNRSYSRATLAGFYRTAAVGLVTPLRDGMNLVAKEYVAAQDPDDPGVLVLSRFAGSARELKDALIVNPFDLDEMSDAIYRALTMPHDERVERWRSLMDVVEANSISVWRDNILGDLGTVAAAEEEEDLAEAPVGLPPRAPAHRLPPVTRPPF